MSAFQTNPSSSSAPLHSLGWNALPESYRIPEIAPSLADARAYCGRLAKTHYENFSVATWFLPAKLRQHFYNVYAYCRISDDLGDEVGNPQQSLELLDQWESELDACYAESHPSPSTPGVPETQGSPRHPVFVALAETVRQFNIPKHEFSDLLIAFRQDQNVTRFETFDDVLGYCRYSANPVGHLVLYLCGYSDAERQQLSDYTCTALQLANFWQDVVVDFGKGRIYLPLEDLRRFGVSGEDIAQRRATPQFIELMKFQVQRAGEWFERGLPLIGKVNKELAIDLELFSRGGQEILNAIERQGFDVLRQRPAISKSRKLWLVARAAAGKLL
jgi:squalene synthase HpnC